MKVFFTILICKLLRFVGGLVGKGSSLPGQVALKICPDILGRVELPEFIIAVTGSNGKTSTVEMIAHILQKNGRTVSWNREGSNQIEGVTTLVLGSSTFSGKVKSDILLIESDERFARYTFKYIKPTHYVITNLYRDQLTRNGHPEWVYDAIADSIYDGAQLILNADDPLVSRFGLNREDVIWFGADTKCDYKRHDTEYTITAVDLDKGVMEIDGKYQITLALKSLYNIYNILSAYTVARIVGVDGEEIARDMSDYVLKNGRVITFDLGGRQGTLLTSKHENSISYDQSLRVAAAYKEGCDVMIIVDAVSRKYFTSDVSWLWDIDFDMLNSPNIGEIVLAGKYVNDLGMRFSFTDIPGDKIRLFEDINEAVDYLDNGSTRYIYAITCFSDKGKFLAKVKGE